MSSDDDEKLGDDSLDMSRLLLLLNQMADEHGRPKDGYVTRISERTAIDKAIVSKLLRGKRASIGRKSLNRARRRLGLNPVFFERTDPNDQYRDFLGVRVPAMEVASRLEEEPVMADLDDSDRTSLFVLREREGDFTEAELEALRKALPYASGGVEDEVRILTVALKAYRMGTGATDDSPEDELKAETHAAGLMSARKGK